MRPRTKIVAVLVGAFGLTLVPGGTAHAASPCELESVEAYDIVTYGTKITNENVGVGATCDAGNKFDKVTGQFTFADGTVSKLWPANANGDVVTRPFDHADPAGLTKVTVRATEDGVTQTQTDSFYVRRNAKIEDFNASPEDRLVNSNLKSSGKLIRLTDTGTYVAWSNKTVTVDFKASGDSGWTQIGTDITSSSGYFEKTVRTKKDGHWRARAAGTNYTYGPISATDYVNVTNYANCSAVPDSLKPLSRTDPGYEPKLDGDNDGQACE